MASSNTCAFSAAEPMQARVAFGPHSAGHSCCLTGALMTRWQPNAEAFQPLGQAIKAIFVGDWCTSRELGASASSQLEVSIRPLMTNRWTMQKALSVHRLGPLVRRLSIALHPPPVKATPTLNFTDSKQAFAATSTLELLRGAAVLTACSQPWLVRHADEGLALSRRLLGESTTHAILRHTVFAHFVAGEDAAEIAPKLQQLHGVGVGGILDYAAEADLSSPPATPDVNQPSRVYTYESEEKCDANLAVFLEAVDAVHATTPEGFAAVKVTALGDPQLLERASSALVQLRAFFETLDPAGTGVLSREAFIAGWREAFDVADDESAAAFESIDTDASGDVDIIEFLW